MTTQRSINGKSPSHEVNEMATAKNLPANVVSVLLENEAGVTEVFLKVSADENAVAMMPVGVKVSSGVRQPVTTEQLLTAVRLMCWSENHASVFEDGRVARQERGTAE